MFKSEQGTYGSWKMTRVLVNKPVRENARCKTLMVMKQLDMRHSQRTMSEARRLVTSGVSSTYRKYSVPAMGHGTISLVIALHGNETDGRRTVS